MAAALQNMPLLAAAATECQLRGQGATKIATNPDASRPCSIRIHGDLVVSYEQREVGGLKIPRVVHEDHVAFFRSYSSCHETVREFDLAADNWEHGLLPHIMAGLIVGRCRRDIDQHGSVARAVHCDLDMSIGVSVTSVYNEPRALLLSCEEAAAAAQCA